MCYSAESSLRTSTISFVAIVYLLSSGIPHYQWFAILLLGWRGMQFAEYLLWSTNPRKGCTETNRAITLTLIPLALVLQPLGSLFGSLLVIPWNKSSAFRKQFIVWFSLACIIGVYYFHYYDIYTSCTRETTEGHLYWHTAKFKPEEMYLPLNLILYFGWAIAIVMPLLLYWKKSWLFMSLIIIMPVVGLINGLRSDSKASIWCYYTSYSSIGGILALALTQLGITDPINWPI